ncbi:MAG: hypothetical protein PHX21_02620 [bacterium]|nr:hypothetical protein [bacterium]
MNILMLGLGLIAPMGELANTATSGKEVSVRWEIAKVNKIAGTSEFRVTSFNQTNVNMDIFKITEGVKLKFIKKTRIAAGVGAYYITRKVNQSIENEKGICSTVGILIPLVSTKNILVRQEISWHTVPKGLSLTFYLGTKLNNP